MAESTTTTGTVTEKTFTAYNNQQGQTYAEIRREYHPNVYETIITQHKSTGGQLDLLMDVGCGPGRITAHLRQLGVDAFGIDLSPGMVEAARREHPGLRFVGLDASVAAENARNIAALRDGTADVGKFLAAPEYDDIWDVVVLASSLDARVELAIGSQEPSVLTRFAFELAQLFNVFYHKHPILKETDAEKRAFLMMVTALVREQLVTTLGLLGITAPDKM